jgi:hypothetical protein
MGKDHFEQTFNLHSSIVFEEMIEKSFGDTLIKNILNHEQMIEDYSNH